MIPQRHTRRHNLLRINVWVTLLISFLASFTIAYMLHMMSSSIMGFKMLGKPTFSFSLLVVAIWFFLLLLIKRYTRLRDGFGTENFRKNYWLQGIVLVLMVLVALIGCSALAGFFTGMLYFSIGVGPSQFPLMSQVLKVLLGVLLLLLVGHYLKYGHLTKTVNLLAAVIRVLENIAHGNYKARLGDELENNGSLKDLVKSVNNMAADLEQLENMRQEFISNVSHEIQSPLASIRGFAIVLQNEQTICLEERQLYLGIIEAESLRLSRLSESLLQLAVLDSENLMLESAPYRLDNQLRNLILACEPQWRGKLLP
ncbi:histidine kinase dimerization/phospho-acceptor domain-containing protein [Paenibacillus sanguinis]|uniref:histidine kinase dimerization/phospho-acceptor domain-containing protein n=1 Tax=Paenibacillus sanguinis TaxID=225906 RepID=UPI00036E89E7|nr:HAMP domain-containing sensor histidine kinase [Paenibacillus sanguinis]